MPLFRNILLALLERHSLLALTGGGGILLNRYWGTFYMALLGTFYLSLLRDTNLLFLIGDILLVLIEGISTCPY